MACVVKSLYVSLELKMDGWPYYLTVALLLLGAHRTAAWFVGTRVRVTTIRTVEE